MLYSERKELQRKVVKSKPKALRHFKVDPVLRIYKTIIDRLNLCE